MLIIETNILKTTNCDTISDHQSRIIYNTSWEEYVNNYNTKTSVLYQGTMSGYNFRKDIIAIEDLKYDSTHLSCTIIEDGIITTKLAYKVNDAYKLGVNINGY